MPSPILRVAALVLFAASGAATQETERIYLSGTGPDDAVQWDFRISAGRKAGDWATIEVPSQWEQQGFGTYAYGWEDDKPAEIGEYRFRFDAPEGLSSKRVWIVFESSMTDTEVRLNGEPLGDVHQGGFTRFRYPVDDQLRAGGENFLEVRISAQSADDSVNEAERDSDYWVFGGIFRPVYLEVLPRNALRSVAIAASHTGDLRVEVDLLGDGSLLETEIREDSTGVVVDSFRTPVEGAEAHLTRSVPEVRPWSAEDPQLYRLTLTLLDDAGSVLHRHTETFGFRSIEIDAERGILVNGTRVLLKGINRHSFRPETGRSLTRAHNEEDARLIKAMNMNAVRTSHYPPDVAFLEACDRIGLYVLDELPGWHDAYDTDVGAKLVKEMVERDRNHPSILFWDNGNEGGWNTRLDRVFEEHDLQGRPVLHPDEIAGGLDTEHYPNYEELRERLEPGLRRRLMPGPPPPVMPTETLHGLYDGGMGAGLADYWELIRTSPLGAGLFLWTFVDEGIERTDQGGKIDTFYNLAPDGIVGPYREKEASFFSVREIWSPIAIEVIQLAHREPTVLRIENRYDRTNLKQCRLSWAWLRFPGPGTPTTEDDEAEVLAEGSFEGPDLEPGANRELTLPLDPPRRRADALRVMAFDPQGRAVSTRVWALRHPAELAQRELDAEARRRTADDPRPTGVEQADRIELVGGDSRITLDTGTGTIRSIERAGRRLSLSDGPRLAHTKAEPTASRVSVWDERDSTTALFHYGSDFDFVRWRLDDRGWLHLSYQYQAEGGAEIEGVLFEYPEALIESVRWLAAGPHRAWRNRTAGTRLGTWSRRPAADPAWETWDYPVLEGFYTNPYWARLTTTEGELVVLVESNEDAYLSLLQPRFPPGDAIDDEPMARFTRTPVPSLNFGLLHQIPAPGTKFQRSNELGPSSVPHLGAGTRRGALAFRFTPSP